MDIYTVSLFGHRNLLNPISAEERLEQEVYKLLKNQKYQFSDGTYRRI